MLPYVQIAYDPHSGHASFHRYHCPLAVVADSILVLVINSTQSCI